MKNSESEPDYRRLAESVIPFFLPQVEKSYKNLSERKQLVLDEYFGIKDGIQRTYADLGKKMGISRQRVNQLKDAAMNDFLSNLLKNTGI